MDPTIFQDPNSRKDMAHLSGSPEVERFRLLMKWLIGNHVRRRALATEIVAGTGKLAVPVLLDEALAPRKSAQQRLRFFDVMDQIGQPLDMDQWMELCSSVWRNCPVVAVRILRLLRALQPVAAGGAILAPPTYARPNDRRSPRKAVAGRTQMRTSLESQIAQFDNDAPWIPPHGPRSRG
jgi:hypothetical protein